MSEAKDVFPVPACRYADRISWQRDPRKGEEPLDVVLGRRLRRLRVERGLSRGTVAIRLRLPLKDVENYERGTACIEARQLVAYARLFNVRISTFFRDP